MSPAEFVGVCERHGLIGALGRTVLRQVIVQCREWKNAGSPRQVTVNLSWLQLRDEALVTDLVETLTENADIAEHLVLEVTESVFAEDVTAVDALLRLRETGLLVAVDDFGTGSSTLSTLREVPADILKLDRGLVAGIDVDPGAEALLRTVLELGTALGMAVIAEGVEDAETVEALRRLGFQYVQVFHFHVPTPPGLLPTGNGPAIPRRSGVRDQVPAPRPLPVGGADQSVDPLPFDVAAS